MIAGLCFAMALMLGACSVNQDVAQGGLIQKRKYRKGFHLNLGKQQVKEKSSGTAVAVVDEPAEVVRTPAPVKGEVDLQSSDIVAEDSESKSPNTKFNKALSLRKYGGTPKLHLNPKEVQAEQPNASNMQQTITAKYQQQGKRALLLAWIYALMPAVIWAVNMIGFPVFSMVLSFFTLVILIMALVYAFKAKKYSKHARQAIWLVFIAMLFWAGIGALFTYVLGWPLFML